MSYLAEEVYGTPVVFPLDQGILVIDETYNWTSGSFPRDAQQDSFYNYIMAGYKYMPYEFGNDEQKPTILNFCSYSTIAWFADDNTSLLSSGTIIDLRNYLEHGGKLWFAGWKPTGDIRNNAIYPADFSSGSFLHDNMLISHAELSGTADSFQTAVGLKGYPDINVDTIKYPSTIWGKTMRYIEALSPTGTGDTIYVMDMKNDGSSFEGKACAVRDSGKTVFFGFPLYFMDKEQVRAAAQKVLTEFGEPYGMAEQKPAVAMPTFRLYQNVPNPFSKQTTIKYQLSNNGHVSLRVYNIAGQLVKILVNKDQPAGSYTIRWDRKDNNNKQVSAGVYIYHISAGGKTQSRKMIALK